MRLDRVETLPKAFLEIDYRDIKTLFPNPSLIYLKGDKNPPLFISILLHGNEYSGLMIMQQLLKKYQSINGYDLPRSIWLFIGNVEASSKGLRTLKEEVDFNRAWRGTLEPSTPTAKMVEEVMQTITKEELFCAIDLHNNTGKNPPYGCISVVNDKNRYLCSLFNHIAMVFHSPKGVSTMAFDDICPAITLECSTPGNSIAIEKAFYLLEDLLHMHEFPTKAISKSELQLVTNSAVIYINSEITFGFEDEEGSFDLTLIKAFDRHNFSDLEKGEIFGYTTHPKPLIVKDEQRREITEEIIEIKEGNISLKQSLIPAMITLDKTIIRQDCLCYLLKEYKD